MLLAGGEAEALGVFEFENTARGELSTLSSCLLCDCDVNEDWNESRFKS